MGESTFPMSLTDPTFTPSLTPDEDLVAGSLSGDRRAFATIVERYQRLLCSLAYSATGDLSRSEDLAQDAFITAWCDLPKLREPAKLRAWLCMILRHKVSRMRRSDGRQPVSGAVTFDEIGELETDEEPVSDGVVRAEEQELLWSTLERIPENYRTPLVLFYREHQSIEHVAVALDLSEDAVKQRLSRGRKLLQERMLNFVEGALARSTPGKVFTLSVLAALPQLATPAKAATVVAGAGTAAAKGGALAKTSLLAGLVAAGSGMFSAALGLRASLDRARTPTERQAVTRVVVGSVALTWLVLGLLYGLKVGALHWWPQHVGFAWVAQGVVVLATVGLGWGMLRALRVMRELRAVERARDPEAYADARDQVGAAAGVYRSRWTLLGLPLVHVRLAHADAGDKPVVGWIAGGDRAFGLVFAWGAFAVAPISAGVTAVGLLAVGNVSIGVISLGTFALGGLAVGCAAIGVKALAWVSALGWSTAQGGGFVIARLAAEGPIALAEHCNDAAARAVIAGTGSDPMMNLLLGVTVVLILGPIIAFAKVVRQRWGQAKPDGR